MTFSTKHRRLLPPDARDLIFDCCLRKHADLHWLESVVVMPDHVHLLTTPYDAITIKRLVGAIKDASAHLINEELGRKGSIWQRESFDRVVRSSENLRRKAEYIANNPVRAGLVTNPADYPWLWREWRVETPAGDGRRSTGP